MKQLRVFLGHLYHMVCFVSLVSSWILVFTHSDQLSANISNINLEHAVSVKMPLGDFRVRKQMQVNSFWKSKYILIILTENFDYHHDVSDTYSSLPPCLFAQCICRHSQYPLFRLHLAGWKKLPSSSLLSMVVTHSLVILVAFHYQSLWFGLVWSLPLKVSKTEPRILWRHKWQLHKSTLSDRSLFMHT